MWKTTLDDEREKVGEVDNEEKVLVMQSLVAGAASFILRRNYIQMRSLEISKLIVENSLNIEKIF